jgi:DNA ligase-1
MNMQLTRLVDVSAEVTATRSRLAKRAALCRCLREAAAQPPGDAARTIGIVVHYLTGTLPQGRIGLGFGLVRRFAGGEPAAVPTLTLDEVDAAFARIAATSGKGSQAARQEQLAALFARASAAERDFLIRLILGELRQGALEGVLVDAIAEAGSLDAAEVRRAVMLAGELAGVAETALTQGQAGLARFRLTPLAPIHPMLAQPAADLDEAMASFGEAALEYKLDGARVQIHKVGTDVRIFSRRLNDVTDRLPDIVRVVAACPARELVLDGEVIALRGDGRPHPFQVTMSRFGRKTDVATIAERLPLSVYLFDCLYRDGEDLIDRPGAERFEHLAAAVEPALVVPRIVTSESRVAAEFLDEALTKGHEGVMAKALGAPYQAGSRGGDWLKVKLAHTLDLVVLAAEWGSGRRRGRLSNLHLGARDPAAADAAGRFVMLGKTFKGLTDETLEWQTRKLLELETGREGHVVHVRPELVVEIAVNQIQTSPQYPAGMALRFARVKAYREDKSAAEADTVDTVRALHARQN